MRIAYLRDNMYKDWGKDVEPNSPFIALEILRLEEEFVEMPGTTHIVLIQALIKFTRLTLRYE